MEEKNKSALSHSHSDTLDSYFNLIFVAQINSLGGVEVHTYNLGGRNKNAVNMIKCSKSQLNIHDSQGQTELQETLSLK